MYVGYICFCVLESLYSNLSSPKGDMLNLMYTAIADQLTIMDFLPLQNSSKTDVAIPWRCTCDIMRFENPPVEKGPVIPTASLLLVDVYESTTAHDLIMNHCMSRYVK